jgi:hypothetical protein
MGTKLKVSKVTHPENRPTQSEWYEEFKVGSAYIKPTKYFDGNAFDSQVFLGIKRNDSRNRFTMSNFSGNIVNSIYNKITTLLWVG